MNIKEFNDKKQEIYDRFEVWRLTEVITLGIQAELVAMISELQPSTPPTCSTCKQMTINKHVCYPFCNEGHINPITCNTISSCIHHSDYGVEDGS